MEPSFEVIPEKVLRSFFEEGQISAIIPKEWRRHQSTRITTFWLADSKLVKNTRSEIRDFDKGGNGILGVTVNGVFRLSDDEVWSCRLLSDGLLLVDDGEGNYAMIEHPKAMVAEAGFEVNKFSF